VIDAETILDTLLQRDKDDAWTVKQNADQNSIASFPFITWDLNLAGQISNGPGLWNGQVDFNVFGDVQEIFEVVSALYDLIHAWDDTNTGIVDGVGWVSRVDDVATFSSVSEPVIGGRTVIQYAGSAAIQLRN
jgi:hypothetical protein